MSENTGSAKRPGGFLLGIAFAVILFIALNAIGVGGLLGGALAGGLGMGLGMLIGNLISQSKP